MQPLRVALFAPRFPAARGEVDVPMGTALTRFAALAEGGAPRLPLPSRRALRPPPLRVSSIAAGEFHSLFLAEDGAL
jgi:hypothetical protein